MTTRWKAIWILTVITVVGAAGCATAEPHDPATVIADAQCRAWAQHVAQAEYARDARAFAAAPKTIVPGVSSQPQAGTVYGLAGVGSALTDLARQGRERELYAACMRQTPTQQTPTQSVPTQQTPEPARTMRRTGAPACELGMYRDSGTGQCIKIGASPRP